VSERGGFQKINRSGYYLQVLQKLVLKICYHEIKNFFILYYQIARKMSMNISDVILRFDSLDQTLKSVFPKVDPGTVVNLILREKNDNNPLYTLQVTLKPGQDTEAIRDLIMRETGMARGFYLHGTEVVVTHKLNLDLLKRINDIDYVVTIKASPYSAGAATDF
jgi:hypothetical protein